MRLTSIRTVASCALAAIAAAPLARAQEVPHRTQPWDPEIVRLAETLPIQDQGRIKPLSTCAGFKLLAMNGVRRFTWVKDHGTETTSDDEKVALTPTEWLLDCVFFPEQAQDYPCFQLQTWEVADAIHVAYEREGTHRKGKRDRYSYRELAVGRDELMEKASTIVHEERAKKRDPKDRTYVEAQLVQLAEKVRDFEGLLGALSFARRDELSDALPAELVEVLGPASELRFTTILEKSPELWRQFSEANGGSQGPTAPTNPAAEAISHFLVRAEGLSRLGSDLALFAPAEAENPQWLSIADVFAIRFSPKPEEAGGALAAVAALEDAFLARGDMAAMKAAFERLNVEATKLAAARGEDAKIGSEVAFYKADVFFLAQWLYVLGFVLVAAGWLVKADAKLHRFVPYALMVPLALHAAGIAWRCYLRARPPVSTLYETILFISGVAVLAALIVERIDRRRIAVAFAAAIGAAGLFLAARYEAKEAFDNGSDTMPQLVAVLDTNFWLSTHVTTVTIGYSAGLLAALLAHVYVLGKLFGLKKNDTSWYRAVARMTYGVICFGLLFSVVGTILGGVWANDSWGRFWGWDPKENGALMICLFELAILHARMGGYIRDLGLCTAAVFGGTIVAFSWWHVNLLGVGLHSYGFTHGLLGKLWIAYGIEWLVVLGGVWLWLDERARRKALAAAPAAARGVSMPAGAQPAGAGKVKLTGAGK